MSDKIKQLIEKRMGENPTTDAIAEFHADLDKLYCEKFLNPHSHPEVLSSKTYCMECQYLGNKSEQFMAGYYYAFDEIRENMK